MSTEIIRQKFNLFQDIQRLRIAAKGRTNNLQAYIDLTSEDRDFLARIGNNLHEMEKETDKNIATIVKKNPLWQAWLKDIVGIGPHSAAFLLGSIIPERMPTCSSLFMFCGLGVINHVRCSKCQHESWNSSNKCRKVVGKDKKGNLKLCEGVTVPIEKEGQVEKGIQRAIKGEPLFFNKKLKAFLLSTIGDNFLRCNSPYRKFYDDYKNRWVSSGKAKNKLHAHRAAIRFMLKAFLKDYYFHARTTAGLEARPPYEIEILGKHQNK